MISRCAVAAATLLAGCCVGASTGSELSPDEAVHGEEPPEVVVAPAPDPTGAAAVDLSRVTSGDWTLFPEAWRVRDEGREGVHDWNAGDDGAGVLQAAAARGGAPALEVHERLLESSTDPTQQWTTFFHVFESGEQASTFADAQRAYDETATEAHPARADGTYLVIDRVAILVSSPRGGELARHLESLGFVLARESYGSAIAPPID